MAFTYPISCTDSREGIFARRPSYSERGDRFLRFLASPAKDPVEAVIGNDLSIVFHTSLLASIPLLSLLTMLIAS
ncbi:hypothetical protein V7166_08820 [Bacillus thuringiensis]